MANSSTTIHFKTDLATAIVQEALVCVYTIEENSSVKIAEQQVGTSFSLDLPITESSYCYATLTISSYAIGGTSYTVNRQLNLLSVFTGSDSDVVIGLQSTIAALYTFARMTTVTEDGTTISMAGKTRSLRIAYGMKQHFFTTNGEATTLLSNSPNGLETNSFAMFHSLSSHVYYCITDEDYFTDFLKLTTCSSTDSLLTALLNVVHNPFTHVRELYDLIASKDSVYQPALNTLQLPPHKTAIPDQWTLSLKFTDSGALNFLMSGIAFVVFDKEDKAWITNNFRQGTAFSGTHCSVLNSDGTPCSFSPIMGGGILGPGFGAAIDPTGEHIAIGNFGWGPELFNPCPGSISMFSYTGTAISPPNGFTNQLSRVQGMCYDKKGNLWMASVGSQLPFAPGPVGIYPNESANSAVVVYLNGDPNKMLYFDNFGNNPSPNHNTFDVAIDNNGDALVSNIGSADYNVPSSVHKFRLDENGLTCIASWNSDYYNPNKGTVGYEELRQVTVNKNNEVFVVGITSSRVIKLTPDLKEVITTYTNNIFAPWGITFDDAGTMYLANFAQEKGRETSVETLDMQGPYGVTIIDNEDEETARLMTLPTGGSGVTLRNGQPLYGTMDADGKPVNLVSYEPIMRLTSTGIDGAGNLWAMNNWKPSATVDVLTNPGGDGTVVFIGVAQPKLNF